MEILNIILLVVIVALIAVVGVLYYYPALFGVETVPRTIPPAGGTENPSGPPQQQPNRLTMAALEAKAPGTVKQGLEAAASWAADKAKAAVIFLRDTCPPSQHQMYIVNTMKQLNHPLPVAVVGIHTLSSAPQELRDKWVKNLRSIPFIVPVVNGEPREGVAGQKHAGALAAFVDQAVPVVKPVPPPVQQEGTKVAQSETPPAVQAEAPPAAQEVVAPPEAPDAPPPTSQAAAQEDQPTHGAAVPDRVGGPPGGGVPSTEAAPTPTPSVPGQGVEGRNAIEVQ